MTKATNPYVAPSAEGIPGGCTSDSVVDYEFIEDDWVHFAMRQNLSFQQGPIRQRRRLFWLVAIIAVGCNIVWISSGAPWLIAVPLSAVALLFIYRAAFFESQYKKQAEQLFRKMLTTRANPSMLGLHRMELTKDGIRGSGPGSQFSLAWWAVSDVEFTDTYLFVYLSSMSAHCIPARAFANPSYFEAYAKHARHLWEAYQEPTHE